VSANKLFCDKCGKEASPLCGENTDRPAHTPWEPRQLFACKYCPRVGIVALCVQDAGDAKICREGVFYTFAEYVDKFVRVSG